MSNEPNCTLRLSLRAAVARGAGPDSRDNVHSPDPSHNDGPDLYTGIALEIGEIAKSVSAAHRAALDMLTAQRERGTLDLKAACEQIDEHAHQAHLQAKHLAGLLARHVNRRPRP
jgi:hypothetical protein